MDQAFELREVDRRTSKLGQEFFLVKCLSLFENPVSSANLNIFRNSNLS
jgi:hypothetical protein